MNLSKLAEITNGKIYNNKNINIKNIKIDSNQITEGDLFIAIIGQNKDGHDYIESAIKKRRLSRFYQQRNTKSNTLH